MDYIYGLIYLLITIFFIFNIESEDLSYFVKQERLLRYIVFIPLSFYSSYRFVNFLNVQDFTAIIYVTVLLAIKKLWCGLYFDMKGFLTIREILINYKNYDDASKSEKINNFIKSRKMKVDRDVFYNS